MTPLRPAASPTSLEQSTPHTPTVGSPQLNAVETQTYQVSGLEVVDESRVLLKAPDALEATDFPDIPAGLRAPMTFDSMCARLAGTDWPVKGISAG